MITRYLTDVTAKINPFSQRARAARVFLSMISAEARSNINVKTTSLPRLTTEVSTLDIKFKDGKEMKFNLKEIKINEIVDNINRHSRELARSEDLAG